MALLEIRGLRTHFRTDDGWLHAVDGVDLSVDAGETVCIVGESGSGKSVTAMSVLQLVPMPPGRIVAGQVLWDGRDLVPLAPAEMQRLRGREIGVVFQEPMTALNPVYTVGEQIAEGVRLHEGLSAGDRVLLRVEAHDREAGDALAGAGLADDAERLALLDLEADAVDGLDDAVVGAEMRAEVVDLEEGHGPFTPPRRVGYEGR